jgi:hypothetical protein
MQSQASCQLLQLARLIGVGAQRPLAVHVLARLERSTNQLEVLGNLDRDRHRLDVGVRDQFARVRERASSAIAITGRRSALLPGRCDRDELDLRHRSRRRQNDSSEPIRGLDWRR